MRNVVNGSSTKREKDAFCAEECRETPMPHRFGSSYKRWVRQMKIELSEGQRKILKEWERKTRRWKEMEKKGADPEGENP